MTAILNTLKLTAARKTRALPDVVKRRNKLLIKLGEQRMLAAAQAQGQHYTPTRFRSFADADTGTQCTYQCGHDQSALRQHRNGRAEHWHAAKSPYSSAQPVITHSYFLNPSRSFALALSICVSSSPLRTASITVSKTAHMFSTAPTSMAVLPFCSSICLLP